MDIKLVVLESPYAGDTEANLKYARECAKHCAYQAEATQASHLYYTQFLDDKVVEERLLGIALGLAWADRADYSVFYTDRGWSRGMTAALKEAMSRGKPFKIRALHSKPILPNGNWTEQELKLILSGFESVELKP